MWIEKANRISVKEYIFSMIFHILNSFFPFNCTSPTVLVRQIPACFDKTSHLLATHSRTMQKCDASQILV